MLNCQRLATNATNRSTVSPGSQAPHKLGLSHTNPCYSHHTGARRLPHQLSQLLSFGARLPGSYCVTANHWPASFCITWKAKCMPKLSSAWLKPADGMARWIHSSASACSATEHVICMLHVPSRGLGGLQANARSYTNAMLAVLSWCATAAAAAARSAADRMAQ
jgi:hypothetical protein